MKMNPPESRDNCTERISVPVRQSGRLPCAAPRPGWRPSTTQERLLDLERMREQINGYTAFICQVASLRGTSIESKENAVAAFHEWMAVLEGQLARIHDELRFG
jgi:hypothetical protein